MNHNFFTPEIIKMIMEADFWGFIKILVYFVVILFFLWAVIRTKTITEFLIKREEQKQNRMKLEDELKKRDI
jgi:hypothetical protein